MIRQALHRPHLASSSRPPRRLPCSCQWLSGEQSSCYLQPGCSSDCLAGLVSLDQPRAQSKCSLRLPRLQTLRAACSLTRLSGQGCMGAQAAAGRWWPMRPCGHGAQRTRPEHGQAHPDAQGLQDRSPSAPALPPSRLTPAGALSTCLAPTPSDAAACVQGLHARGKRQRAHARAAESGRTRPAGPGGHSPLSTLSP